MCSVGIGGAEATLEDALFGECGALVSRLTELVGAADMLHARVIEQRSRQAALHRRLAPHLPPLRAASRLLNAICSAGHAMPPDEAGGAEVAAEATATMESLGIALTQFGRTCDALNEATAALQAACAVAPAKTFALAPLLVPLDTVRERLAALGGASGRQRLIEWCEFDSLYRSASVAPLVPFVDEALRQRVVAADWAACFRSRTKSDCCALPSSGALTRCDCAAGRCVAGW